MFGHGSAVEAHTNFGRQLDLQNSPLRRPNFEARLRYYNEHYDNGQLQVKKREVNGRPILEGPLKVHWGVVHPITLQQKDEPPEVKDAWRRSYSMAINNGLDEELMQTVDGADDTLRAKQISANEEQAQHSSSVRPDREMLSAKYNTIAFRKEKKRKKVQRCWSMINGHVFDVDTSTFTPAHGSMTNVTITSLDPAPGVIKMLLEKFKVVNNPEDFCLCSVKKSGETRILGSSDFPLLEQVLMGPLEDECRIFITEKNRVHTVSEEVSHFVNLPEAVLSGFLEKYNQEEEQEIKWAKHKFEKYRRALEKQLAEVSTKM